MMKKLIIAGGSGFLGSILINHFQNQFEEIVLLSQKQKAPSHNVRTVLWDAKNVTG
ncbi:hypothetical protein ACFO5T_06560 [Dokdonia genika]|uniref:NAD-dependent epimerase/dehydratase domain-containing protein n=1 Tax=Dokdonia genika TaxID=308113 RepID=A0ABV9L7I4_9FLAO